VVRAQRINRDVFLWQRDDIMFGSIDRFGSVLQLRFFIVGFVLAFFLMNTGFVATTGNAGQTPAHAPASIPPNPAISNSAISNSAISNSAIDVSGVNVRLMSWNSFFRNENVEGFRTALTERQPDILALQEVNSTLVDELTANWQEIYPYMALYPTGTPAGMGIVSRYPLHIVSLPDFDEETGCNCQVVTIEIDKTAITLINAHPWPPEIEFAMPRHWSNLLALNTINQDPIFEQLMAKIEQVDGPLLVAGDLNTMPFQPNVKRLQSILTDSFVEAGSGLGYTFPADGSAYNLPSIPFMRIDYIFHNQAWQAASTHVGVIHGSDHSYVLSDLILHPVTGTMAVATR